jgi:hypothetical protein
VNLVTDAELAEKFRITVERLHTLRRRNHWPFVQLGRFDIRFTEQQVEQIVALHSEAPAKVAPTRVPAVTGQTASSAARRRSA